MDLSILNVILDKIFKQNMNSTGTSFMCSVRNVRYIAIGSPRTHLSNDHVAANNEDNLMKF